MLAAAFPDPARLTPPPPCTARLQLRRLDLADTPVILRLSREPGLARWLPDQVYRDEAHAAEVIRYLVAQYDQPATPAAAPWVLGVCLRPAGELIGHVGFSPCPDGVEVGYAIGAAQQGRGLAGEAVQAAVQWALAAFRLPFVVGVVDADNTASRRVLERVGFRLTQEAERDLHGVRRRVLTYRFPAGAG